MKSVDHRLVGIKYLLHGVTQTLNLNGLEEFVGRKYAVDPVLDCREHVENLAKYTESINSHEFHKYRNPLCRTPLHHLVARYQSETKYPLDRSELLGMVQLMLAEGANPLIRDAEGRSAIALAWDIGAFDIVAECVHIIRARHPNYPEKIVPLETILKDVDILGVKNKVPLIEAAEALQGGDISASSFNPDYFYEDMHPDLRPCFTNVMEKKAIIGEVVDYLSSKENLARAFFVSAAEEENHELEAFLERNLDFDVNTREEETQKTALHYAAEKGNIVRVLSLLHRGAIPLLKSSEGLTAIDIAAQAGRYDIVMACLKNVYGRYHELGEIELGETTECFVECGARHPASDLSLLVNHKDHNGHTMTYHAAERGDLQGVLLLHSFGASPNQRKKGTDSPLFVAMKNGKWEVALHFLEIPRTRVFDGAIDFAQRALVNQVQKDKVPENPTISSIQKVIVKLEERKEKAEKEKKRSGLAKSRSRWSMRGLSKFLVSPRGGSKDHRDGAVTMGGNHVGVATAARFLNGQVPEHVARARPVRRSRSFNPDQVEEGLAALARGEGSGEPDPVLRVASVGAVHRLKKRGAKTVSLKLNGFVFSSAPNGLGSVAEEDSSFDGERSGTDSSVGQEGESAEEGRSSSENSRSREDSPRTASSGSGEDGEKDGAGKRRQNGVERPTIFKLKKQQLVERSKSGRGSRSSIPPQDRDQILGALEEMEGGASAEGEKKSRRRSHRNDSRGSFVRKTKATTAGVANGNARV